MAERSSMEKRLASLKQSVKQCDSNVSDNRNHRHITDELLVDLSVTFVFQDDIVEDMKKLYNDLVNSQTSLEMRERNVEADGLSLRAREEELRTREANVRAREDDMREERKQLNRDQAAVNAATKRLRTSEDDNDEPQRKV